jgi:Lipocalin-like domain
MMFLQTAENRKRPAGAMPTDAERVALFNTLIAYAGTYKVNGSKVLSFCSIRARPKCTM